MKLGPVIPILRMFDIRKAKEFYVDFLGFKVDWEHRFGPEFPLYMQLSRADCLLHISEHHGDAAPGSAIRVMSMTSTRCAQS
jgi:catechol 2,3-dioxygenase-like lactoylglutathione lyase family enzyme